jgi:hypothetical protein
MSRLNIVVLCDFRPRHRRLQFSPGRANIKSTFNGKCIKHADSAAEWIGTHLSFALSEKDGRVHVRFRHADWKETTDFLAFCGMKWATFLLSLRESLETGVGRPNPHDLQIT